MLLGFLLGDAHIVEPDLLIVVDNIVLGLCGCNFTELTDRVLAAGETQYFDLFLSQLSLRVTLALHNLVDPLTVDFTRLLLPLSLRLVVAESTQHGVLYFQ